MRSIIGRLLAFIWWRRVERDLDREVAAHLALIEDDFVSRGLRPDEARIAARRALGGIDQTKERHRDARSFMWLEDLRRDVPYALRGLRRAPGFTVAAIVTLALGIGATTTVFSVVNAVLLQPLPYKDSDRLVRVVENQPPRNVGGAVRRSAGMPHQELLDRRGRMSTLSSMAGYSMPPITLMLTPSGTVRLWGALVSPDLFAMLGAQAVMGRTLRPDDASSAGVVVLSTGAWQRYFHSDPGILGRVIRLKTHGPPFSALTGLPMEVVGIMPSDFDFPAARTDFWTVLPKPSTPQQAQWGVATIARLGDGISIEAAADELNTAGNVTPPPITSGPPRLPLPDGVRRFEVERVKDQMVAPVKPAFRMLGVAVGVVLLIVCANVANLLLARGTVRQREIGVRLAIGASRSRIVRQVVTESLVLALAGGLVGTALAVGGVQLLRTAATPNAPGIFQLVFGNSVTLPRLHEVGVDNDVLAFAMLLAAVTAMVFGIAPALHLSRVDHLHAMGYRGAAGGQGGALRTETRTRSALVVGQLVLATGLMISAGLLINSFVRLSRVDPGYEADRLLTFYLVIPEDYATTRKTALVEDLMAQLRKLPRVHGAAFTYAGPLLGVVDQLGTFVPPGRTLEEMRDNPDNPKIRSVSHDFLQTAGVRLVEGRWFNEQDNENAPPVLIVNRSTVRRVFGNVSPIGMFVQLDGRTEQPPQQIVGVVEDMRTGRFDQEPVPQMFVDYRQMLAMAKARSMRPELQEHYAFGFLSFVVRTDADPAALIPEVRALVGRVDPLAGIDAIAPMRDLAEGSMTRQRFYALLLGIFAGIAGVLGAIGIYGVLAYAVVQRTQEIGVRMALGAQRRSVLSLVLRQGLVLAAIGIVLGLCGAAAGTRYLQSMLFGLTPLDPFTFIAVATAFALVAALASYLPARRATKVDPVVALRCE